MEDISTVLVLLPLYNGEKHLRPQLDSILAQTYPRLLIVCRDDGSTDHTVEILLEYQKRHPERFHLVDDGCGNLGASANFSALMQYVLAEGMLGEETPAYISLADQDDIWHPDKIARCVALMKEQEHASPGLPVAVHSDLRVVTETGDLIAPSFMAYQGLQPQRTALASQLLSNTLTGCSCLLNRALLLKALPVPPQAIMHDWWLALVASSFGRLCYIPEALLDYRQHGGNTIGAKAWQKPKIGRGFFKRLFDRQNEDVFTRTAAQARSFLQRYSGQLSARQRLSLYLTAGLALKFPPLQKCAFRLLRRL